MTPGGPVTVTRRGRNHKTFDRRRRVGKEKQGQLTHGTSDKPCGESPSGAFSFMYFNIF